MERFTTNNTNTDPFIRNNQDTNPAKFGHINAIVDAVTALQNIPPGSGVASVQAGTDISVDNTDPLNPIVNSTVVYSSGSFTPTVSNETFNEVVTPLAAYYSRVNDVVTCTYFLDVALDAAETEADFELSLPVPSNFTNVKDLVGIVAYDSAPADLIQWGLSAETVNNTAKINLQNANMGNGFQYIYITLQYLVL